jgi:hypothetical protein
MSTTPEERAKLIEALRDGASAMLAAGVALDQADAALEAFRALHAPEHQQLIDRKNAAVEHQNQTCHDYNRVSCQVGQLMADMLQELVTPPT